jgi:hypothetical protein
MENYIRFFSPTFIGLITMYYYNKFTTLIEPIFNQTLKTYSAICDSFSPTNTYYFYENIPIPMNIIFPSFFNTHNEPVRWYYYPDTRLFTETLDTETSLVTKKIEWLSAEIVIEGNDTPIDISDFIRELSYISKDGLPPKVDILLGLWSYSKKFVLKRAGTKLNVINNNAECFTFDYIANPAQTDEWLRSIQ